MQSTINDIPANQGLTGAKTEFVDQKTLESDGYVVVLGGTKYGGNNGLDHVVQFVDPADGVLKTMVIDSKQLAKNGTASLDPKAAGGVMQLSDDSLRAVISRLGETPASVVVEKALDSGTLVKAIAYIDKSTGELKFVRLSVPNSKH